MSELTVEVGLVREESTEGKFNEIDYPNYERVVQEAEDANIKEESIYVDLSDICFPDPQEDWGEVQGALVHVGDLTVPVKFDHDIYIPTGRPMRIQSLSFDVSWDVAEDMTEVLIK